MTMFKEILKASHNKQASIFTFTFKFKIIKSEIKIIVLLMNLKLKAKKVFFKGFNYLKPLKTPF